MAESQQKISAYQPHQEFTQLVELISLHEEGPDWWPRSIACLFPCDESA